MLRSLFAALCRGANRRPASPVRFTLDGREVPAVLATFSPAAGTLSVFGDNLEVSRNAAGGAGNDTLLGDNGDDVPLGGPGDDIAIQRRNTGGA